MKFAVVCAHIEDLQAVKDTAQKIGFTYDENNPQLIISYGGDGTFLRAERQYPSIPKLPTRKSRVCRKCHNFPLEIALQKIMDGNFKQIILPKLKAIIKTHNSQEELLAVNDIAIRNANLAKALRFTFIYNGQQDYDELIGDGVVLATPFGSAGYYHSVSRQTFDTGFSLAFNNNTEAISPIHFESEDITIKIIRGPAQIAADNFSPNLELYENETVTISLCEEKAIVFQPE